MSNRVLVIYHASCSDGFCAAWLFHKAFPSAGFHAANHSELPPNVTGKDVYIVDFSYKRPVMKSLACTAARIVVLDHHRTAQQELDGLADECRQQALCVPEITFDMDKSGGRLAWEYLCRNDPVLGSLGGTASDAPWLVDYTEDRDLWRWKLNDSKAVNAALRSYPMDFETWDQLVGINYGGSAPWRSFVAEGNAILRMNQQIIDSHVRKAKMDVIAGHMVPVVNATVLFSEIAGELAKGQKFAACYFDRADGKRQYSLRSDESGMDVSEVAKSMGGGGHKKAAGFEL